MSVIERPEVLPGIGRAISRVAALHSAYVERFDHPFVFALLPTAVVFLAVSAAGEVSGWNRTAGFLALFAIKFVFLWSLAYASFYGLGYAQRFVEYWRVGTREHGSRGAFLAAELRRRLGQ